MSNNTLKFLSFFPDSFNLHGDRGNVLAFEKVSKMLGLEFEFEKLDSFSKEVNFLDYDIIFVSPSEVRTCEGLSRRLFSYKDKIREYIEKGKIIIVVGTSICLFAKQTTRMDGSVFEGFALAEVECKERKITYSNDVVFTTEAFGEKIEVVGGQIQMVDVLSDENYALGEVTYGYGNCHKKDEGYIKDGFIFTNSLGPVFVKNPRLAEMVIKKAMLVKGEQVDKQIDGFEFEEKSNCEIKKFIKKKIEVYDASRLE